MPVVALVLAALIAYVTGLLPVDRLLFPGPWPVFLIFAASTQAAVIEEIAFRGVLMQGIERMSNRTRGESWCSGLLFASLHLLAPVQPDLALVDRRNGCRAGLRLGLLRGRPDALADDRFALGLRHGRVFLLLGLPGETRGWLRLGSPRRRSRAVSAGRRRHADRTRPHGSPAVAPATKAGTRGQCEREARAGDRPGPCAGRRASAQLASERRRRRACAAGCGTSGMARSRRCSRGRTRRSIGMVRWCYDGPRMADVESVEMARTRRVSPAPAPFGCADGGEAGSSTQRPSSS